jgi:flagellar protein FliO/FliZ
MTSNDFTSLLWFIAIIVMIPVALWLLKRTPAGGGAAHGLMRNVAMLPVSPNQRLLLVEVGSGEERRWLVLGVTAQSITTLHAMAPQDAATGPATPSLQPVPFGQLLTRLRQGRGWPGDR